MTPERQKDLLAANLAALDRKDPDLARRLAEANPLPDLAIVFSQNGMPVARIGNITLHSLRDPEKEARDWVQQASLPEPPENPCIEVFGFGTGYHIRALLDGCPVGVTVYEPRLDVIRLAFSFHDYTGYIHRLKWIVDPQKILAQKNKAFLIHRPSARCHKDLLSKWQRGAGFGDPLQETIENLKGALQNQRGISDFLQTLPPGDQAEVDFLAEKILGENRGPLQEWETLILLLQELKDRSPDVSNGRHKQKWRGPFAGPLKTTLEPICQYEKFKGDSLRILLINSQYLMMGEIVHALQHLGHALRTIIIEREAEMDREKFIEDLLKVLMEFKPDFILTVNHLGLDREGTVGELLTHLRIPFASWYVDSPMLIIKHYARNLSPLCAIFLWDEDYLADVQALGFDKVHYLPLAADPDVFRPVFYEGNPFRSQAANVSFVGNSMAKRVKAKMEKLGLTEPHREIVEKIARDYAWGSLRNVSEVLDREPYKNDPLIISLQDGRRVDFEALIMYQATLQYRLSFIRKLAPFQPVIRGDEGWRYLLDDSFHIGEELSYYYDLNYFYNVCQINFNITSTQMRNAVNQRVFDVPAAGRFLLTDYKIQLAKLLEIGKEIICYRDPEEIPDLVHYYLVHDSEREKVAAKGRQRILAEHTYAKRVHELCQWMRKHFQGNL